MSAHTNKFRVRNASSSGDDAQFIVAAWDSTLPYLASVGAGEMWGEQPFSEREGFQEDIVDIIRKSEEEEQSDSRRLLVAEVDVSVDGKPDTVRAGAAMIRDALPYYLVEREELKSEIDKAQQLLFIEVIVADHRPQQRRKGAGAALVEAIKHRALERGKDIVYVDVWAGNNRKLNRYYENLGFKNVGDFTLTRKSGATWLGTLYCLDLSASN